MKKIIKIITFYDDGTFTESVPTDSRPVIPQIPLPIPQPWITDRCIKCGLELKGTMGYVCTNNPCPSGFGGVSY